MDAKDRALATLLSIHDALRNIKKEGDTVDLQPALYSLEDDELDAALDGTNDTVAPPLIKGFHKYLQMEKRRRLREIPDYMLVAVHAPGGFAISSRPKPRCSVHDVAKNWSKERKAWECASCYPSVTREPQKGSAKGFVIAFILAFSSFQLLGWLLTGHLLLVPTATSTAVTEQIHHGGVESISVGASNVDPKDIHIKQISEEEMNLMMFKSGNLKFPAGSGVFVVTATPLPTPTPAAQPSPTGSCEKDGHDWPKESEQGGGYYYCGGLQPTELELTRQGESHKDYEFVMFYAIRCRRCGLWKQLRRIK